MKMKMPVLLHVVRVLLSLKLAILVYWMVLLQIKIRDAESQFLYLDANSEGIYYSFGVYETRIYLALIPALLAIIFISCKMYKTTMIILIISLMQAISSKDTLFILIHLFILLVVLLHRPSQNYLRRRSSNAKAITATTP